MKLVKINNNVFLKMKSTINIIIFLFSLLLHSQAIKQEKRMRAIAIYGYFTRVETTLETISAMHPEMQSEINNINLLKTINFGQSKKNAMTYLDSLGEWQKVINKTIDSVKIAVRANTLISSKEQILKYLKDTEQNLKGSISPPLLEYALAFQYENKPSEEFRNGFTYTFNTKGHKKSKNTEVIITVPKSWASQEGNDPNDIQIFNSDCGSGLNTISMITQEMPLSTKELKLSFDQIDKVYEKELFTEEFAKNITDGNKLISFKPMKIADRSGCLIVSETITKRMGVNLKIKMYTFAFHDISYLHLINCGISTFNANENLLEKSNKIYPLFFMIINSIVVPKKNQDIIYLNGNSYAKTVMLEIGNKNYEFLLDTGATVTSINQEIFEELCQKGVVKIDHFLRKDKVELANGQQVLVEYWTIPQLKIGNRILTNIVVVIQKNNTSTPLLGMNILSKLNIWKIDLENNKIYLYK